MRECIAPAADAMESLAEVRAVMVVSPANVVVFLLGQQLPPPVQKAIPS